MLLTEITGPDDPAQFLEAFFGRVSPQLDEAGMPASAWLETNTKAWGEPPRFLIQVLQREVAPNLVDNIALSLDSRSVTRIFAPPQEWNVPLASFLPMPGHGMVVCDMPFNRHQVSADKSRQCPGGHVLSDDHHITCCPVCGGQL